MRVQRCPIKSACQHKNANTTSVKKSDDGKKEAFVVITPNSVIYNAPESADGDDDEEIVNAMKHAKTFWGLEAKDVLAIATIMFTFGFIAGIGFLWMAVHSGVEVEPTTDPLIEQKLRILNANMGTLFRDVEELEAKQENLQNALYEEKQRILEAINNAVMKYDDDKTGLIDYALEARGGSVIHVPTAAENVRTYYPQYPPETILRAGNQPGQCFEFAGSKGRIRIRLVAPIEVTAVTVEHVSYNISYYIRSAPRKFTVYGLINEDNTTGHHLGDFEYILENFKILQTFYIRNLQKAEKSRRFQFIEFYITSNHGHPTTCVYRVRVHGIQ